MTTFMCVVASIGTLIGFIYIGEGLIKLYDIIFKTGR